MIAWVLVLACLLKSGAAQFRPFSHCELQRQGPSPEWAKPKCNPDGSYKIYQCDAYTRTTCWCVYENGQMIPGTTRKVHDPEQETRDLANCEKARKNAPPAPPPAPAPSTVLDQRLGYHLATATVPELQGEQIPSNAVHVMMSPQEVTLPNLESLAAQACPQYCSYNCPPGCPATMPAYQAPAMPMPTMPRMACPMLCMNNCPPGCQPLTQQQPMPQMPMMQPQMVQPTRPMPVPMVQPQMMQPQMLQPQMIQPQMMQPQMMQPMAPPQGCPSPCMNQCPPGCPQTFMDPSTGQLQQQHNPMQQQQFFPQQQQQQFQSSFMSPKQQKTRPGQLQAKSRPKQYAGKYLLRAKNSKKNYYRAQKGRNIMDKSMYRAQIQRYSPQKWQNMFIRRGQRNQRNFWKNW